MRDEALIIEGRAATASILEFWKQQEACVDTYWKAYLAEYTTAVVIHYRK